MNVRNPTDAARPKIIWPVHPTVTHRPRWTAIKRVDSIGVVERHLVLAERLEVVVQRADGHGVEETRRDHKRETGDGLVPKQLQNVGVWGGGRGKGKRSSPPDVKERGCHRHQ